MFCLLGLEVASHMSYKGCYKKDHMVILLFEP